MFVLSWRDSSSMAASFSSLRLSASCVAVALDSADVFLAKARFASSLRLASLSPSDLFLASWMSCDSVSPVISSLRGRTHA